MNQHSKKGGNRAIKKKSFKINNLNVFKDKGGQRNKIKTEGSETRTGGYGKIRNFRNEEIVTGIKKIESMGGLVNKSCQNLVA